MRAGEMPASQPASQPSSQPVGRSVGQSARHAGLGYDSSSAGGGGQFSVDRYVVLHSSGLAVAYICTYLCRFFICAIHIYQAAGRSWYQPVP